MISKKSVKDLVYKNSKLYEYPSLEFINSLFEISDASNAGLIKSSWYNYHKAELYDIIFNGKNNMSEELKNHMSINVYFTRGDIRHNIYSVENDMLFEYTYFIDMTWEMIEKQYNIKRVGNKLRIKDLHNGTQWHAPYKLTGMYRLSKGLINKLKVLGKELDTDIIEKLIEQGNLERVML